MFLEEDSMNESLDDEIVSFLRNTAIGDKKADPFLWWKTDDCRDPNISVLASDTLAIQATSVASEEAFSEAGNLVSAHRSRLSDESISAEC